MAVTPSCNTSVLCIPLLAVTPAGLLGTGARDVVGKEKKRKEKFTLFSNHNGSLLRRQPGVGKERTCQANRGEG